MGIRLVRRDQFNITPQGITHKPTDAGFMPYPGRPFAGIWRMGNLGSQLPDGDEFDPVYVRKLMQRLWNEYVAENADLFN